MEEITLYDWCKKNKREDLLKEWNCERNKGISYKNISYTSSRKVWWKIYEERYGKTFLLEWESSIRNRINGRGCPYTSNPTKKIKKGFNDLATWCKYNDKMYIIKEWSNKNEMKPENYLPHSNKEVIWEHTVEQDGTEFVHEWTSKISNRTSKNENGCPYCSGYKILKGYNDFKTWCEKNNMLFLLNQWNYTKNNKLQPETIAAKNNKKIWWECECGYEWSARISNRTILNRGCPRCAKERKSSFQEKAILFYIKQVFNNAEDGQYYDFMDRKELDIYIPSLKLAIEYDGEYAHRNRIREDLRKSKLCRDNQITLIRVREPECNILDDNAIIYELPSLYEKDLEIAIEYIINYINDTYNYNFNINIDISRDRAKIYELLEFSHKKNSLISQYPDLVDEWNYEKNIGIKPNFITPGSNRKVWWKCGCGNEWEAVIYSRVKGNGCPDCGKKKQIKSAIKNLISKNASLYDKNKDLADEWHPEKNGHLTPKDVTPRSGEKVWWLCLKCNHEWQQSPHQRSGKKARGCPECAKGAIAKSRVENSIKKNGSLLDKYPETAALWNYEKNYPLTPDMVTSTSHKKVWWIDNNVESFSAIKDKIRPEKRRINNRLLMNKN